MTSISCKSYSPYEPRRTGGHERSADASASRDLHPHTGQVRIDAPESAPRGAGDDGHRGDDASPYPAGTRFRDDDGASRTSDQLSEMPISSHHYGSVVHSEEEYGIRDTSWIPPSGRIYRARTLSSVHLISDI